MRSKGLKNLFSRRWSGLLLLLIWMIVGASLRFTHLDGKPPWTDEFATLVFSLGNSFKTVPLNQVIPLETLLAPLRPNPNASASDVIHYLITEDHHPPLYFVLVHWWMQLFPANGYVSLWAARSLPALFGVASIPAVYGLAYLTFRSSLVAQLSAALIAVSPYGIFLTQEARHYALAMLWVIASLSCLVIAGQYLHQQKPLPIKIALCWVVVNSLGMATHYFFSLTLLAQAIALIALIAFAVLRNPTKLKDSKWQWQKISIPASWWRIVAVAAGTFVGCLVWLPVWQTSHNSQMTQWIMTNNRTILSVINPIFQSLAAWITMICLLPIETPSIGVTIASGAVMLAFFIFATPIIYRGSKALLGQPEHLGIEILAGFVLGAIALFFAITYILGTDITRGARYNFVYFPAIPVLIAAALILGQQATPTNLKWRRISIIWLVGLLSGITVVNNWGYQKYYRPDLLLPIIQQASKVPVVFATTHNTLVQTGEMMSLAWEFKTSKSQKSAPQFLLAHQEQDRCEDTNCPASQTLQKTIAQLPKPLDLWLVNFKAPTQPEPANCFAEDTSQYQTSVNGYSAKLYHCLPADAQATGRL